MIFWRNLAAVSILAVILYVPVMALAGEDRFVQKIHLSSGPSLVVAEGEFEPRSVGSYVLRLYSGAMPEYPFDDFVCGLVRPRDGAIERLQEADVTGDGVGELVVVIRSAGTGGYLSADAWRVSRAGLSLAGHVEGLGRTADPLAVLRSASQPGEQAVHCGRRRP